MKVLVLAHGILGFGAPAPIVADLLPEKFHYFSEISGSINHSVINVLEPDVSAVGKVYDRAKQLANYIYLHTTSEDEIYIIAHSMGGLDAIQAIPKLRERKRNIVALTTIGTPFRGSPVADAVYEGVNNPLFEKIPIVLVKWLKSLGNEGLKDLTIKTGLERKFYKNQLSPVKIFSVAGNILINGNASVLFDLASIIGGIDHVPNDGVVTKTSAQPSEWEGSENIALSVDDWLVDHGAEIGWPPDIIGMDREHLNRYYLLIERMTGMSREEFQR